MAKALPIDIANREDIRDKLPEVRKLVDAKREELAALEATYSDLLRMAGVRAPAKREKATPAKPGKSPSTKEQVVRIIEDAGRPMQSVEVATLVPNVKRDTVNWALWNAEKEGLIQKTAQGVYAALTYDSEAETLLASPNGATPAAEGGDDES